VAISGLRVYVRWVGGSGAQSSTVALQRGCTVSVVVAAYNEDQHVWRLLRSLRGQSLPPVEVIVADDGSTDRTAEVAERLGAVVLRLPHRGPAVARNAASARARGQILVFLDGDMECAPNFLDRLVAPIAARKAVATFSREIFIANPENRWARAYAALRGSPPDRLLPEDFPDRWQNFRAVRRDRFLAVGGYDDVGYGEDMTLAPKVGELALAAPEAICFHHHPSSLAEIFENGRWVGRGAAIRALRRPWWIHSLPRVLMLAGRQIAAGRTAWVLPARIVYHAGVWVGLASSRLTPERHWK
jgi:glycosyltransferase involved in cell wall biosynthesis